MVKVLLVERQGSIAFSNFNVALDENVPFAVAKTLVSLEDVGRFNNSAISQKNKSSVGTALVQECFASYSVLVAVKESDDSDGMQVL